MSKKVSSESIDGKRLALLVFDLKKVIGTARYKAFNAVNAEMLKAYYDMGRRIVEEEQKGKKRAEYGKQLIDSFSKELIKEFGREFSLIALKNMHIFYKIYSHKNSQSVTNEFYKLSWTHYCEIIKIENMARG